MTASAESPRVEAWFLNEDLLANTLGPAKIAQIARSLGTSGPLADVHRRTLFQSAASEFIDLGGAASLAVELLHARLQVGQLVLIEQAFYFKGVPQGGVKGKPRRGEFHGKLDVDPSVTILGDFNIDRLTSSTARSELSGRKHKMILAYVKQFADAFVDLRPIVIGDRFIAQGIFAQSVMDANWIHPHQIAQFSEVDFNTRMTTESLEQLREIPEDTVKKWFAEILGEPDVPKDWGGEQFDLWTCRVRIGGLYLRTAIAFKGPAAFHPMKIADLGKNGDQIDRLADTEADLLVVQHCHGITAPVHNMLKAYATQACRVRRYATIDGYQTLAILKHFGYLD